jgi:carboxy-cis,cis-muconate cyclase
MSSEPYYAFSASWPAPDACGMAFSVDSNGGLASVVDSWAYANESGVHGLALTKRNGKQLIYSADTSADLVWIHQVVRSNGSVSEVGRFPMPYGGMNPRHLIVHPGGKYLYAVMEADNSITQFDLDVETGLIMQDSLRVMLIPIGTREILSQELHVKRW